MRVTCTTDPVLKSTLGVLAGHLDPQGALQARDDLLPRIGPDAPSLLLDLRAVDWMSSAGVGALMNLLARAQTHRGTVSVFGCVPRVRSVLRVCGLEGVLNVCDTEAASRERLQSFKAP